MSSKLFVVSLVACCECVYMYSSFYAPLAEPRVLRYRVDGTFEDAAQSARDYYQTLYGYRGRDLIENLGNGKGPGDVPRDHTVYGDIKFYYTYPGAYNK